VPMTRRSLNAFVLSGLTGTATLTTNVPITDVPLRQSLIASVRSASAVTLDANASKVPGLYRGHAITIGGEVRTIVSYSAAREAVVSPEFNSLPAAGVTSPYQAKQASYLAPVPRGTRTRGALTCRSWERRRCLLR
jgi:hypothetical protein